MSKAGIITTDEGRKNAPLDKYEFPTDEGSFIGRLVYRTWRKRHNGVHV